IVKREHCLEDKTLYLGIKKIYDENEYAKSISASSYRLLMQGYTDRLLINLVIKNYKGSIGEWKSLRKTMKNYNMEEKEIDEKILESCIMMHIVDADSEDIFCSIYNNDKENRLIGEYVQLLCYKIIAEKKSIENMTLKTLERIYKEKGEDIVAVAIGEIYLRKRYEGEKDDFIIGRFYDIIEKNKILFPEFKDKDTKNPYIEKNMPFIYRTAPNKKVYLHYRRLDENMYSVKEMNYFRYGFYMSRLSVFYGEKIEYFFSEKLERGSIESKKYITENKEKRICEVKNDDFFKINNALIYAEMFQYDKVEDMIEKDINNKKFIKGRLL
ncbi:MAG: hypothetical protein IJ583_03670, partial [Firmicutes bacterium]|nr:hypothetical protein [Bacillota bacterium]